QGRRPDTIVLRSSAGIVLVLGIAYSSSLDRGSTFVPLLAQSSNTTKWHAGVLRQRVVRRGESALRRCRDTAGDNRGTLAELDDCRTTRR
ncbi:MAG: hypothetical protein KDA99_08155, partial [Planctomycetales bacterium]|nr:hypothetical protein [Planctomycetales bacterium]